MSLLFPLILLQISITLAACYVKITGDVIMLLLVILVFRLQARLGKWL